MKSLERHIVNTAHTFLPQASENTSSVFFIKELQPSSSIEISLTPGEQLTKDVTALGISYRCLNLLSTMTTTFPKLTKYVYLPQHNSAK